MTICADFAAYKRRARYLLAWSKLTEGSGILRVRLSESEAGKKKEGDGADQFTWDFHFAFWAEWEHTTDGVGMQCSGGEERRAVKDRGYRFGDATKRSPLRASWFYGPKGP